jgi:hypothetical protein
MKNMDKMVKLSDLFNQLIELSSRFTLPESLLIKLLFWVECPEKGEILRTFAQHPRREFHTH